VKLIQNVTVANPKKNVPLRCLGVDERYIETEVEKNRVWQCELDLSGL
jgi:hypothetical protein